MTLPETMILKKVVLYDRERGHWRPERPQDYPITKYVSYSLGEYVYPTNPVDVSTRECSSGLHVTTRPRLWDWLGTHVLAVEVAFDDVYAMCGDCRYRQCQEGWLGDPIHDYPDKLRVGRLKVLSCLTCDNDPQAWSTIPASKLRHWRKLWQDKQG